MGSSPACHWLLPLQKIQISSSCMLLWQMSLYVMCLFLKRLWMLFICLKSISCSLLMLRAGTSKNEAWILITLSFLKGNLALSDCCAWALEKQAELLKTKSATQGHLWAAEAIPKSDVTAQVLMEVIVQESREYAGSSKGWSVILGEPGSLGGILSWKRFKLLLRELYSKLQSLKIIGFGRVSVLLATLEFGGGILKGCDCSTSTFSCLYSDTDKSRWNAGLWPKALR